MRTTSLLSKLLCNSFFCLFSIVSFAQIRLPAIIGNNMVLQQNSPIALWGWAAPGETIHIQAGWATKPVSTTAGADGKWQTHIATGKAGGPYKISLTASNSIELSNILLGEVWLCSGQSNMHFPMTKYDSGSTWATGVPDYENEIASANHPLLRLFTVDRKVSDTVQQDLKGNWQVCTPQTIADFSAVAYYFAREIQQATGYPVGLINSTWGGTPAESWTKKQVLESDSGLSNILKRYQQQCADYPAAKATFDVALQKWKLDTSAKKRGAPREPIGPNSNKSPYKLYNAMIAPLVPYTLKGVIWYQGESNADRAWQYRTLFPAMIQNWRTDWHQPKLPFYFVQISPHRSQNPEIREAQLYTYRNVPHTGIVITTDNGDSLDIHPRNKKLVGERLSKWALYNDYGRKNIVYSSPLYKSMKLEDNKIRIRFDFANDGLIAKNGDLTAFTIAADDKNFVPAKAIIDGNTVVVWSDEVKTPVAVRFAWSNVPHANLYNKAGLPASPFRTDIWALTTEGKN